ncbi:MAG: VOC family protein [Sphaerobacteraceae bacterium]|nr:MAG: VOC family protein [Sphaerobacteraceae bacterium]
MNIVPYLNFDGNCREAFEFYREVLGGEEPSFYTNEDVPMDNLPAGMEDMVIHAQLTFEGQTLMGCDNPTDWYEVPRSISVSIQLTDPDRASKLFTALAEGGQVSMPWGEQPWGAQFGMATDRFGIPWMINCEPAS